jgi:hypothetical protein
MKDYRIFFIFRIKNGSIKDPSQKTISNSDDQAKITEEKKENDPQIQEIKQVFK